MAEIIVLNNVFDTKDKNCYLCNEQKTIKEFLYEQNLDKKDYSLTVEIYDPETDTTYYEPLEDDESNMLVNINVNGLVKDLDYKIQPCDKIIIEILPASSSNNEDLVGGLIISGMFFAIAALAIFTGGAGLFGAAAITGEILANYGTILGFGLLAAGLGATTLAMTLSSDNTSSSELSSNSDDNSERNPSISGSQNQALGTNAFPLVIGDVIATPFVVGSFYTEYEKNSSFDKTWLGSNQKAYLLLAVGYAPLLIKDIKLDELKIAGNPKNVLNGILSLDYGSDEIGASWKNNNPRFEISQFGQNRTIYPYTVKQKKIESTLLYCYDKQYSDIATENTITWQGGTFPTGMRNIPIYFSESVPYKISVGIKFPAGLYETWADSDGNTMYRKIPMNLVVQWRPYYKLVDKNSNATDNGTSRYNKAEGYTIGRYGQWRDFDDNAIIPKVTYNAKDWKYHYKVYSRIDKLYTDGNGNVSTSYGYKKDDYFGYWEVYTNSENNYATDYSDKVNEDERVDDGSNFRWVPLLKYLSKEECKNLFVQAFLAKRKINPNATTVWVDGKCYSTVGHSWNTTGSAKRWANQFYEEYYYDQHFCWAREHPNIREVLKDTPYQVTNSRVEVQSNYGLSDGTDTNCNPNWIGSTVFCFGKYSGGVNFYKQNDFMPETISNADREKLFVKNINDAKDEMDFELTATLDQDTILDLINRNPKSIELGGVDDDATTVNEFSDNTECLLDSIQVRVVRLTPCYVAKNIDSQQHSYQDVVQWSYLKTYCLDKQKLLQDIDYVEKGKKFPKINCNADSYNVDTQATVITPDGKETLNVKEVMTKEGSSKWNAFPISNYYSTPLNKTDQENLVTIGVEITPDKLGYISNSINKINLSAKAIMPAFVSNKLKSNPNFIRYVKKENNLYFFCDRYDAQSDILGISDDSYSITNSSLKWELASSTGANSEIFDEIKSSALTEIGSKDEITYSYYLKNNSWDKVFFPKKIETKQIDELVTDNNGNVVYEDATTLVPMYEKVKYGNDWFNYIKNEMALNKKSYYDSNSNLIGTRWEATESFINTFCSQNAIVQALGFLTGKSLGKDAYAFNSYNTDKFLRLWRVKGGEYFYYNTDLTDAVPITELDSVLKYAKEAESGSEIIFTEESPIAIDYQNPNYVDWKWYYSFRKAEGNFNPVTLREAIEYTDNIDIGGSYGELKYKCNLYVYQQQKVVNLFSTILSAARAYWFYDEKGRYEIHNDKPLKNPVLLITDENCLSSSNTRSFTKQIAGYHITFKDENNSFQNGEIYVLREGQTLENHTRDIKDLSFSGITNAKQEWALGAYLLGQSITQREIWTRKLNHIGNSLTIGSLVNVQSSTLEIGTDNSGRITKLIEDENYIYGFLIDNVYSYRAEYNADESNVQGCSIMQPTESTSSRIVTVRFANKNQQTKGISVVQNDETIIYSNCYGKTNLVLLEKRIIKANHKQENQKDDEDTETSSLSNFIPKLGDIVAFGNVGRITSKAVVFNLTYDENNCVTVQLYPYFDSLYSAGKKLPIYESNITRKSITDNIPIKNAETYSIVNNSIEKSNSNIQSQISKIKEISSTTISYGVSESDSTEPTTYSDTIPTFLEKGTWLWVKTIITYSDNSTDTLYTKTYIGTDGADGKNGTNGTNGKDGASVIAQYSVDGSTSWHSTYASGDIFMRTSTDSGTTWSSAVRIVGEKGDKGAKGDKGETGATGASGINIKCDTGTLNYTLQRNKKANYESKTFTLALYQGATLLTPTSSSISTANAKNLSVSKSGTTTITITAKSTYNGAIPSGYITATLVYNNVSYSMNIPITTNYNGKYLGLSSELPSSANIGDYFVASKTFTASNTTYTQAYVYERVCSAANTYAWIVSTEINSVEVFSDILSLASAANNTQAVAIVQRLVASDIFVNNLSTQKILFQHFVASISSENPTQGDMMIYMGKNPKLSDSEYRFGICSYQGNLGGSEMWKDLLKTSLVSSGLALLITGCLNVTQDIYINNSQTATETEFYEYQKQFDSNILYDGGVLSGCTRIDNETYLLTTRNHSIYTTKDFKIFQGNNSLKNFMKKNFPDSVDTDNYIIYSIIRTFVLSNSQKKYFYFQTWNGYVLYTEDFLNWEVVSSTVDDNRNNLTSYAINFKGNPAILTTATKSGDKTTRLEILRGKNIISSKIFPFQINNVYVINSHIILKYWNNNILYFSILDDSLQEVKIFTLDTEINYITETCYNENIYIKNILKRNGSESTFELLKISKRAFETSSNVLNCEKIGEYTVKNDIFFYNARIFVNQNGVFFKSQYNLYKIDIMAESKTYGSFKTLFSYPENGFALYNNDDCLTVIPFSHKTTIQVPFSFDGINWKFININNAQNYTLSGGYYISENRSFLLYFDKNDVSRLFICRPESLANLVSDYNNNSKIQSYNLAETGYVKWSNGFLIQWGKITHTSSSNVQWLQATLPISYKSTTSYIGMCSTGLNNDTNAPYAIVNNNNKINEIGIQVRGASSNIRWLTVGYA